MVRGWTNEQLEFDFRQRLLISVLHSVNTGYTTSRTIHTTINRNPVFQAVDGHTRASCEVRTSTTYKR
jgi:hypothetical protein